MSTTLHQEKEKKLTLSSSFAMEAFVKQVQDLVTYCQEEMKAPEPSVSKIQHYRLLVKLSIEKLPQQHKENFNLSAQALLKIIGEIDTFLADAYLQNGQSLLVAANFTEKNLQGIGIITTKQKQNLTRALGEGLISIDRVKEEISQHDLQLGGTDRQWSSNQFTAMLIDQGLNLLRNNELCMEDFRHPYIPETLNHTQVLKQIIQLKQTEMDFYKNSVIDFKIQSKNFQTGKQSLPINNPYFLLHESILKTEKKLETGPTSELDTESETPKLLPQGNIAWDAIAYARKFSKKSYTAPESKHLSPQALKNVQFYLNATAVNIDATTTDTMTWLEKHGLTKPDIEIPVHLQKYGVTNNTDFLMYGAEMHSDIMMTKSTFLANCDQMCLLVFDFLYNIGFTGKAALFKITGNEPKEGEGHTFVLIALEDGSQQIWDPWSGKAYDFTDINLENFLTCWKWRVKPTGVADHQLEPYKPELHQFTQILPLTLQKLYLFRHVLKLAKEKETIATEDAKPTPDSKSRDQTSIQILKIPNNPSFLALGKSSQVTTTDPKDSPTSTPSDTQSQNAISSVSKETSSNDRVASLTS